MRAGLALMECGVIPRPDVDVEGDAPSNDAPQPPNVLVSNRTCTSGSSCTKSESMVYKSTRTGDNTWSSITTITTATTTRALRTPPTVA